MKGGLVIGQVARQVGVTPKAIRFYEAKRVLAPPTRGPNGYRLYGQDATETLTFVKQATGLGLTLAEVREIIAIRHGGAPPCVHVHHLLEDKARELDRKLRHLIDMRRQIRRSLAEWSGRKRGRAVVCQHIEARRAAGPPRAGERAEEWIEEDLDMEQLQLHVSGMTCTGCEHRIQRALAQVDGVVRSTADHQAAQVRIVFDPARTSAEAVRARIKQAGYEVVR